MAHDDAKQMVGLPLLVVGPVDLGRLIRELDQLDEAMHQAELRGQAAELPHISQLMDKTLDLNKLDARQQDDRRVLREFLQHTKQHAPVLHMSFSAEPGTIFTEKLMAWLRREIHPLALVTVGMQPNIGAGCIIRTTNQYFDLSLRKDFAAKRDLLRDALSMQPKAAETPA